MGNQVPVIIGVDEVGRGCWAGPLLVVAARAKANLPSGVKDSKRLSKKQRLDLYEKLLASCDFGAGWVSARELDKLGLSRSLTVGAKRALSQLKAASNDRITLDGKHNYLPGIFTEVNAYPKADSLEPIVSAASIYAKVLRDNYMVKLSKRYLGYYFERHVGYGTGLHREAILKLGVIEGVHRQSYKPIAELL